MKLVKAYYNNHEMYAGYYNGLLILLQDFEILRHSVISTISSESFINPLLVYPEDTERQLIANIIGNENIKIMSIQNSDVETSVDSQLQEDILLKVAFLYSDDWIIPISIDGLTEEINSLNSMIYPTNTSISESLDVASSSSIKNIMIVPIVSSMSFTDGLSSTGNYKSMLVVLNRINLSSVEDITNSLKARGSKISINSIGDFNEVSILSNERRKSSKINIFNVGKTTSHNITSSTRSKAVLECKCTVDRSESYILNSSDHSIAKLLISLILSKSQDTTISYGTIAKGSYLYLIELHNSSTNTINDSSCNSSAMIYLTNFAIDSSTSFLSKDKEAISLIRSRETTIIVSDNIVEDAYISPSNLYSETLAKDLVATINQESKILTSFVESSETERSLVGNINSNLSIAVSSLNYIDESLLLSCEVLSEVRCEVSKVSAFEAPVVTDDSIFIRQVYSAESSAGVVRII